MNDPRLYPFGAEFFQSHAHLSVFPDLVGGSARLAHVSADTAIFAWHVLSVFLLLLACWRLAGACFQNQGARWGSVVLMAGVLSVPVAGTALVIMDPYLTGRSLSTPASVFAIACALSSRRKEMLAWLGVTTAVHPQMGVYAAAFLACGGCMALLRRPSRAPALAYAAGIPFLFPLGPVQGPAREALLARTFFFVSNWTWYEWTGVFAPLGLLWWASSRPWRGTGPAFREAARPLAVFGALFTLAGLVVGETGLLENYTRLQPMRAFHLLYVVFFVLLGGLLQEYFLKRVPWRWAAVFVPLALGMWLVQRGDYPASAHVELPGAASSNTWTTAFLWVREHTPKDAVFALDPNYMKKPGEDMHGFRAVAERSVLADAVKDSGAVSLFPQLAERWKRQTLAGTGWNRFGLRDFQKLAREYPVTWIVTSTPAPAGIECPYQNRDVAVCELQRPATNPSALLRSPSPKSHPL